MMVFIDGENLVARYQKMLALGYVPREDLVHDPDTYVWGRSFTVQARHHEVIRATYYTYATGDDNRINAVRDQLRDQEFSTHMASLMPNTLTPCVFKKENRSRSGKGVDIQMCVDILGHVYRGNTDSILIMSGDGDFEPLIREVSRTGVQIFLSAFSSGLNPKLERIVDSFYCLDGTTWLQTPEEE